MDRKEVYELMLETVKQTEDFFKSKGIVGASFSVKTRTTFGDPEKYFHACGGTDRQGYPMIRANLGYALGSDTRTFYEYRSFAKDPQIGTVFNNTRRAVQALVIHEVCHAVVWCAHNASRVLTSPKAAAVNIEQVCYAYGSSHNNLDTTPHGGLWKFFYRQARNYIMENKSTDAVAILNDVIKVENEQPVVIKLKKVKTPKVKAPKTPSGRQQAFNIIRVELAKGTKRADIVKMIVTELNIKPATAAVYTYAFKG